MDDNFLTPWVPELDCVTHVGGKINENMYFFKNPPSQIGKIISAYSTATIDDVDKSLKDLFKSMIKVTIVAFIVIFISIYAFEPYNDTIPFVAGAILLIFWVIGYNVCKFKATCSYVGTDGIAIFTCKHNVHSISSERIFCFCNAQELRVQETRQFVNGAYTGTNYNFIWSYNGKKCFNFQGQYHAKEGLPKEQDLYNFAKSGELEWSNYILAQSIEQLKNIGYIQFNLKKNDFVRIGPGFMEFSFNGRAERCDVENIEGVSIHQGFFTIKRKDASAGFLGFFKDGVFTFAYAQLPNSRVFLLVLEKLLGFRFE